jgi:hypothetical protein
MAIEGRAPTMSELIDQKLAKHETAIKELFPDTFTHIANINTLPIRFNLKLMGFDYRSEEEFASLMAMLEIKKLILRDGMMLKRNHRQVY